MNGHDTHLWGFSGPCFIVCLAIAFSGAIDAGAQGGSATQTQNPVFEATDFENSLDENARALLTEARWQLQQTLAHPDGDTRFEALREVNVLHEPWIAELVLPIFDSPDITEQNLALEAIAASNPQRGRRVFLAALDDPHRSVRLRGLLGLERLADPSTVVDVSRVLETDEDPDLKVVAARALGAIGDIGGSTTLRTAIQSPYAPLRRQAVLSLLAIGKEDVGRHLIRLMDDSNRVGTVELLKLVGLVPDPTLIELLAPYLDHEKQRIRSHAAVAVLSILERSRARTP